MEPVGQVGFFGCSHQTPNASSRTSCSPLMNQMDDRQLLEQELLRGSSDTSMMMNSNNGEGLIPMLIGPPSAPPPTHLHQYYNKQQTPVYDLQAGPPRNDSPVNPPHLPQPPPPHLGHAMLQSPAITGLPSSKSTASSRDQLLMSMNMKRPPSFESPVNLSLLDYIYEEPENKAAEAKGETVKGSSPLEDPQQMGFNIPTVSSEDAGEILVCSSGESHEKNKPAEPNNFGTKPNSKPRQGKKKEGKWLTSLEHLKEYKRINGDCIVPRGYMENPKLASWVSLDFMAGILLISFISSIKVAEQRKQYRLFMDKKQSSINQERIDILNEIGFTWNAQEAAWARHMADLRAFREEHGHCHVPLMHEKYPKLGLWVKEQRRHYTLMKQDRSSHMTADRRRELNALGFCWDTHEATWQERWRELKEYKEVNGNCSVPTNYFSNPKLGTWVHHQRRQWKKFNEGKTCHITRRRIDALTKLGFVWQPREREVQVLSDAESTVSENSADGNPAPSKRRRES